MRICDVCAGSLSLSLFLCSLPSVTRQLASMSPLVAVIGGAVSLLLAFRTNAAYNRFGQAADSFAEVLAATRNLSRKMAVWCPPSDRAENARLVAAIPWAVKHRGQGVEGTSAARIELEGVLGRERTEALLQQDDEVDERCGVNGRCNNGKLPVEGRCSVNVPMRLMTAITREIDRMNECKTELIYQLLMDNDLTVLHSHASCTDRLASTPTPVSYSRHLSRGLVLWLFTLGTTFAAAPGCPPGWAVGPMVFLVAWLLLGIDDVAMQLEQPYTVMAVRQFCEECQHEVLAEIERSNWACRIGVSREETLENLLLSNSNTSSSSSSG